MKKLIVTIILLLSLPFIVKANIMCNDGTESPSCSDCHQGCCSHHGGCLNYGNNYDETYTELENGDNEDEEYKDDSDDEEYEDDSDDEISTEFMIISGVVFATIIGVVAYTVSENNTTKKLKKR